MPENLFGDDAPRPGLSLHIIGVGGAGCNTLLRLRRHLSSTVVMTALDTSQDSLASCGAGIHTCLLANKRFGGRGAGDDADGLALFLESEKSLPFEANPLGTDLIVLVGSLGGATGSATLPWLTQRLADTTDPTDDSTILLGFFIQPLAMESALAVDRSEQTLEYLSHDLNSYMVVLNDRLANTQPKGTFLEDAWYAADQTLVHLLDALSPKTTGTLEIDPGHILSFLRFGGQLHFGTGTGEGAKRVEESLEGAVKDGFLRPLRSPPHRALVWVDGPGITTEEHKTMVESVAARLSPAPDGLTGSVRLAQRQKNGKMTLSLLLSPEAIPGARLRGYQESYAS
ncbi:hypothetical protein H8D30_03155 [bacterium]|nr:hypothetical protein [bacterium]